MFYIRFYSDYSETVFPLDFSTISVPIVSTIPTGREIHADCTKPATMYVTKEIAATSSAYGSCVVT